MEINLGAFINGIQCHDQARLEICELIVHQLMPSNCEQEIHCRGDKESYHNHEDTRIWNLNANDVDFVA